MKKIYYFTFMALLMAMVSACSSDEPAIETVQDGEEVQMNFAIQVPVEMDSRTISDGKTVRQLHYTIIDVNDKVIVDGVKEDAFDGTSLSTTLSVTLLKGALYRCAFWADAAAADTPYTYEKGKVTISTQNASAHEYAKPNDESYDAFYALTNEFLACEETQTIQLTRPFAQLNIAATEEDWTKANELQAQKGEGMRVAKSALVVDFGSNSGDGTQTFDIFTGNLINKDYTLAFIDNVLPGLDLEDPNSTPEKLVVGSDEYYLIATAYLFVPKGTNVLGYVSFYWGNQTMEYADPNIAYTDFENVPFQRNCRTNIVGNILTGTQEFSINVEPSFSPDKATLTRAADSSAKEDVYFDEVLSNGYGKIYSMGGVEEMVFENKHIYFSTSNYGGLNGANLIKFKNCIIEGTLFGYTNLEFEDCTFSGNTSQVYPVWTYGAQNVTFTNCLFSNRYAKAILVYNEGGVTNINVNVVDCTFNGTLPNWPDRKAAVQIHTEYGISGTVNITNSTYVNRYDGLWDEVNNQTGQTTNNFTITVNGVVEH